MKNYIKLAIIALLQVAYVQRSDAQGMAINADGTVANPSAMLDVKSSNKGLLIPRVALTDVNDKVTIPNPANSLLVFNTNANMVGGRGIGYYYNSGSSELPAWIKLIDESEEAGWLITGNSNLTDLAFMGTTDDADVIFKRDGIEGYRITKGGALLARGDENTGITPVSGAGRRLMWIPAKGAFRAGAVTDASWNDGNVGLYSFATGINTTASGLTSTAMGFNTTASGLYSTAMGSYTTASKEYSTAIGYGTIASKDYSTAMGYGTKASGRYSTAIGYETTASGENSTAMGSNTVASGDTSTAMGYGTTASRRYSTAMGYNTKASGDYSTAMGYNTIASKDYSTAMGYSTTASQFYSTAMGLSTTASGNHSTAMGSYTTASGNGSTAMGFETTAIGFNSTAMGSETTANGNSSTAMGANTTASGTASTAMGANTTAGANYSTAMGLGTVTNIYGGVVFGRYNVIAPGNPETPNSNDRVFQVGDGISTSVNDRKDIMYLTRSGNLIITGSLTANGTFYPSDIRLKNSHCSITGCIEQY
ncbi:MAG: hypothetical protein IPJ81_14945 [Chitinophagaceae bacterium]|nr:hypothetical protein [Chitinophagaceae bacterium]